MNGRWEMDAGLELTMASIEPVTNRRSAPTADIHRFPCSENSPFHGFSADRAVAQRYMRHFAVAATIQAGE